MTPKISKALASQNKRTGAENLGSGGAWSIISLLKEMKREEEDWDHISNAKKHSQNMN